MNFQGNFKSLGQVAIGPLRARVEALSENDWLAQSTRQKRYEVHKDTQFIGLVYDEDFRHMKATVRPAFSDFKEVLTPIFAHIAEYYETSPETQAVFRKPVQGYFVRVSLVKLLSGGHISEHRDKNFSLTHSHRVHLPIITDEDVVFKIHEQEKHLPAGEIFEINNRRNHSVTNGSDIDRVHLILDWVFPWEPCCCSDSYHPGQPCTPDNCLETVRLNVPCNCHPEELDSILAGYS